MISLKGERQMTLLRRVAQLVEDLRNLEVIKVDERVSVEQIECGIKLRIAFGDFSLDSRRNRRDLILDCISEEFSSSELKRKDYDVDSWVLVMEFYRIG